MRLLGSVALSLLLGLTASAQDIVSSSPNTVGSGARALGMGSAFIAIADDATAASWNPGGLTQLEAPEFSIVYAWKWQSERFSSTPHPELEGTYSLNLDELNYASFVYPIPRTLAGRNMVVSLNYQKRLDFDRELDFNFRDITAFAGGNRFARRLTIDYKQEGSLSALSPAFGFELTQNLSLGVVWNLYDSRIIGSNEWKTRNNFRSVSSLNGRIPTISWGEIAEDYTNVRGNNWTFGLLWKPTERWSVGAVYNTKFSTTVDYTRSFRSRGAGRDTLQAFDKERRRIEWPQSYGAGIAYRFPNDRLTVSFDWTRREWDNYVEINARGERTSPITGLPKEVSRHKATNTFRLGAEYVFIDPDRPVQNYLPSLRAGLFIDPEPSSGRKDNPFVIDLGIRGDGSPENYYGASLGAGLLIRNRVNIDVAYQYRWGRDVRIDTFGFYETNADVEQHALYVSTVIYF